MTFTIHTYPFSLSTIPVILAAILHMFPPPSDISLPILDVALLAVRPCSPRGFHIPEISFSCISIPWPNRPIRLGCRLGVEHDPLILPSKHTYLAVLTFSVLVILGVGPLLQSQTRQCLSIWIPVHTRQSLLLAPKYIRERI